LKKKMSYEKDSVSKASATIANQAQNDNKNAVALLLSGYIREKAKLVCDIVLDAVFPHKCVCGKWGVLLCDDCRGQIRVDKTGLCPICKRISEFGRTCQACRHRSGLTGVMVLGPHKGILKDLIWKYKYGFIADLSEPLADLVCERYGDFLREKRFDLTFAPISRARLRWRGFNQAELLSRKIAASLNLKCVETLHKADNVMAQVGHTRRERIANMRDKISYIGPETFVNKKILIIDDVYTTGATLEECAKALRKAGYREVWGLVLSRD
jgi:competence protein ComFC